MGMPLAWHRRHALTIASQLPDNVADARLILAAVSELVDDFLSKSDPGDQERAKNVVPFVSPN